MADLEWTGTGGTDPEAGPSRPLPYYVDVVGESGGMWARTEAGVAWSPNSDGIRRANVADGTMLVYTATQEWFDEMTDPAKYCPVQILLGKPA